MQVCTSLQTDNYASTPTAQFLQAGCPSCRPTNSVKALKAENLQAVKQIFLNALTLFYDWAHQQVTAPHISVLCHSAIKKLAKMYKTQTMSKLTAEIKSTSMYDKPQ